MKPGADVAAREQGHGLSLWQAVTEGQAAITSIAPNRAGLILATMQHQRSDVERSAALGARPRAEGGRPRRPALGSLMPARSDFNGQGCRAMPRGRSDPTLS